MGRRTEMTIEEEEKLKEKEKGSISSSPNVANPNIRKGNQLARIEPIFGPVNMDLTESSPISMNLNQANPMLIDKRGKSSEKSSEYTLTCKLTTYDFTQSRYTLFTLKHPFSLQSSRKKRKERPQMKINGSEKKEKKNPEVDMECSLAMLK